MKNYYNYIKENSFDIVNMIYDQDYDAVKTYLENGGDVNHTTNSDISLLMISIDIKKKNTVSDITNLLLDNGADIHIFDHRNWSALNYAIYRNKKDIVFRLIDMGIELNNRVHINKNHSLIQSITNIKSTLETKNPDDSIFLKLLEQDRLDINIKNNNNENALSICVISSLFNNAKILIEKGADITLKYMYQQYNLLILLSRSVLFYNYDFFNGVEFVFYLCDKAVEQNHIFDIDDEFLINMKYRKEEWIERYPDMYQKYLKNKKASEFNL